MAKKLIVGNWKMNPQSQKEAVLLFKGIDQAITSMKNVEVVISAPFPFISSLKQLKKKKITLGAQNAYFEQKGAFTGEVSPYMLRDIGVNYVIVGHSERRALGETDEMINKKVLTCLKAKLIPILCVGESIRMNDASYLNIVKDQLIKCLNGVQKSQMKNIVIAYEPVWALSSTIDRHDATPHDFEEMKIYIKKILSDMSSQMVASGVRIIYGGSANKDNAESFLRAGADGLLPGKASLDAKNFSRIVEIASSLK